MIAAWVEAAPFLPTTLAALDGADVPYVVLTDDSRGAIEPDEVDVLIVGGAQVTATFIEQFPKLKLIVRGGTGVDRIDLDAASKRGVVVTNVPDYATHEVADHTMLLMLSVVRSLPHFQARVSRNWTTVERPPVIRLHGSRLGIIGLGRIGSAVAARARALGMQVVAYDPLIEPATFAAAGAVGVTLHELLTTSDVITLHAPLTRTTQHIIDQAAFDQMQQSPYLINTARGELIDTAALVRALDTGVVQGAGLDVVEGEPDVAFNHAPLLDRHNVIVTPHVGWYSLGAQEELGRSTAQFALDYVRRGILPPPYPGDRWKPPSVDKDQDLPTITQK